MRDPDLVSGAQLAAATLEGAWHRWRVVHGLTADPMPTVSSYVGYSLEEPWGQPRVVFGLAAEDAEQLATLLERHDCVGPVYAAVATLPGARETFTRPGGSPAGSVGAGVAGGHSPGEGLGWFAPLPVPRQAPSVAADQPLAEDPLADADLGEPAFRQAAAAMQEAAAARHRASNADLNGDHATGPEPASSDPADGEEGEAGASS